MRLDTLGTEVAPCVVTEIKEVFSPHLDESAAILRTIARIDGINFSRSEVTIRY